MGPFFRLRVVSLSSCVCAALIIQSCSAFVTSFSTSPAATKARITTPRRSLSYTCSSVSQRAHQYHVGRAMLPHPQQHRNPHGITPGATLHMSSEEAETEAGDDPEEQESQENGETEEQDPRLYSVRISRVTGIEWGTDISFAWVYIRELQPSGSAANSGKIAVGDQLIAINDVNLAGAPFDTAMNAMIDLEGPDVEFTLFRGTKEELKAAAGAEDPPAEVTVTVKQKGKPDVSLKAPSGANLRNLLTDNGINVYQSITRWTNCKGKQLCGTCIVEINQGLESCTVRSLDESSTLRDNPANYRLSCVTDMYDDVTVTVFPPVGAAQWTR